MNKWSVGILITVRKKLKKKKKNVAGDNTKLPLKYTFEIIKK